MGLAEVQVYLVWEFNIRLSRLSHYPLLPCPEWLQTHNRITSPWKWHVMVARCAGHVYKSMYTNEQPTFIYYTHSIQEY